MRHTRCALCTGVQTFALPISVDPTGLDVLQSIVVGGEACPPELVRKWAPGRRLFNGYGPTETTVLGCISDALSVGETVNNGGPVRGVSAVILGSGGAWVRKRVGRQCRSRRAKSHQKTK